MYESTTAWHEVDRYFIESLISEDEALVQARESGHETTMPQAEVAANQGQLLGLLVSMMGARRVLEFGTLAGYSTIWLARAAGENGRVCTLEIDHQNAAIAHRNVEHAGVADRVELLLGPAAESAQSLVDRGEEPFDFVFIDADKPSNPAYLSISLALSRPGSVILIDNVVRNGAVTDPASDDPRVRGVRAVIEMISDDPRLEATSLQTVGLKGWDGFTLVRRTS